MTPKIVSTPNTLSGTPRIDGHRIGVCHILANAREAIVAATKVNFPQLTEAEVNAAIDYAIERCESAPPAQTPRWISVEEKTPEFAGTYVVAVTGQGDDGELYTATLPADWSLEDKGWHDLRGWGHNEVTHWMTLPSAPEAEPAQTPTALAHSSFLSNGICRCACNPYCGCECHKLTNSAPEAEAKTEWATCPKCHQPVNGPHECYESVLNEAQPDRIGWVAPEECTCAFLNIGCSLHDRAEVKIDCAGSNPAPVGAAGDADSVNRSRAYNSQAQTSAAPQTDRCPHECGIDGNHEICKCALCGLTKPINESWCYQTAAGEGEPVRCCPISTRQTLL